MNRRLRWLVLLGAGLLYASLAPTARSEAAAPVAVDAVELTVSDLDRTLDFYTNVLPFTKVSERELAGEPWEKLEGVFGARMRVARLKLGEESIELTEYLAPRGRPAPADARSNDRWFQHVAIVVSDMEKAYALLRAHKVTHASTGPQRLPDWNPNAGGIQAFYFKDPDGHPLEIIWFPKGKGDPRWQRANAPLFMGIDHTAIVVSDTEASLRFWRDTLGLRVAGTSENYGTEQEHLNNVFGARLRITGLRAARGPGIEFLEYLSPRDGRPYPGDEKANDLIHWQTRLVVTKAKEAEAAVRDGRFAFVSPGAVDVPKEGAGLVVRDPDGHAVELMEVAK
jgi:catechol 2,3-dioxygenase-like lactoylglutathione lyase family enzyme